VEATLKAWYAHKYTASAPTLPDEDLLRSLASTCLDQNGELYRSMMMGGVQVSMIHGHSLYSFQTKPYLISTKGMYGIIQ